ncbi:CATRA system-associated protein [Yinghuangia seranimata]|uniref:CATRA system-associated protein n=1 Tax=Yinghuangia seranimata TaxID=408067 RepID=UPI00248CCB84|nr:CATRA system-associated protein [Yinghuangia seranimata]MDI2129430.1 hypothetical protein [Yinghuangia seranimata]
MDIIDTGRVSRSVEELFDLELAEGDWAAADAALKSLEGAVIDRDPVAVDIAVSELQRLADQALRDDGDWAQLGPQLTRLPNELRERADRLIRQLTPQDRPAQPGGTGDGAPGRG